MTSFIYRTSRKLVLCHLYALLFSNYRMPSNN